LAVDFSVQVRRHVAYPTLLIELFLINEMNTHCCKGAKPIRERRNVAVIAHVDHGKTTLVDRLLVEAGAIDRSKTGARVMDSNALEKERGITIMAKQTSAEWRGALINIVDTPGHADFGGEVERVLSMVEGCILVVDASEGVMPQTKFVVQKALKAGLKPILLLNKMDREGAQPEQVQDEVFDLLFSLGATPTQLDYPTVLASATSGWSQVRARAYVCVCVCDLALRIVARTAAGGRQQRAPTEHERGARRHTGARAAAQGRLQRAVCDERHQHHV
jgi:GTP-binding protein TypA/BipA